MLVVGAMRGNLASMQEEREVRNSSRKPGLVRKPTTDREREKKSPTLSSTAEIADRSQG